MREGETEKMDCGRERREEKRVCTLYCDLLLDWVGMRFGPEEKGVKKHKRTVKFC